MAAAKKRTYLHSYGKPEAAEGWHFLTGDQQSITRLTRAVGFRYAYDPASDQFAHAAGIVILTPTGKISRYFYDVHYSGRDLRLGLVEASRNKIGSPIDQILLVLLSLRPDGGEVRGDDHEFRPRGRRPDRGRTGSDVRTVAARRDASGEGHAARQFDASAESWPSGDEFDVRPESLLAVWQSGENRRWEFWDRRRSFPSRRRRPLPASIRCFSFWSPSADRSGCWWRFCSSISASGIAGVRGTRLLPPLTPSSHALEWFWTITPFFIFIVMFFWGAVVYVDAYRAPDEATRIYAVGKQWMWKFQHPEGQREINMLHVPLGRPVQILLTSEDVIHSFFVPDFRVHMDVLPNRYTSVWFQATRPGTYHLFCSQYCGTNHAGMIGSAVVMEPAAVREVALRSMPKARWRLRGARFF